MGDLVHGGFVLLGSGEAEKAMLEAERTRKGVLQMKRGTHPLRCHLSGFGLALPGWNNIPKRWRLRIRRLQARCIRLSS